MFYSKIKKVDEIWPYASQHTEAIIEGTIKHVLLCIDAVIKLQGLITKTQIHCTHYEIT